MATDDHTRLAVSLTTIRQKKPLIHHITNDENTIQRGQKVSITS